MIPELGIMAWMASRRLKNNINVTMSVVALVLSSLSNQSAPSAGKDGENRLGSQTGSQELDLEYASD